MAMKFHTARKFFTAETQITDRVFKGYAATYGNVDHDNDIIEHGAFAKSINEAFPAGKIKVLYQHSEPLGMPTVMHEDSKGLYVEAKISKTRLGDEVIELIKDGVVDSMSVGFRLMQGKFERDASGIRRIKEGALREFSAVTFPANDQAVITGIKALKDFSLYTQDYELSDRLKRELLDELKGLTALLNPTAQPPLRTEQNDLAAANELVKELSAFALQFKNVIK